MLLLAVIVKSSYFHQKYQHPPLFIFEVFLHCRKKPNNGFFSFMTMKSSAIEKMHLSLLVVAVLRKNLIPLRPQGRLT